MINGERSVAGPRRRQATIRRYLMCPPEHFAVSYAINPWMHPDEPTDNARAVRQWTELRQVYLDLGHDVRTIDPVAGLPDMVFAANGGTVVDGKVLGARFRYPQRAAEAGAYLDWFRAGGYAEVRAAGHVHEGEGDILFTGRALLAGYGFRSDPAAATSDLNPYPASTVPSPATRMSPSPSFTCSGSCTAAQPFHRNQFMYAAASAARSA